MSMRRSTEFRWQPASRSRSKFGISLFVAAAGLATGYMFIRSSHQDAMDVRSPGSTLQTSDTSILPVAEHANDEPSAVAITTSTPPVPLLNPQTISPLVEAASDEPSAIATAGPVRLQTAPAPSVAEREPAAPPSATNGRPSASYATLREALLRKIR
jgi:hypothetical protein